MVRLLSLGQLSLVGNDGQPISNAAAQPRRLALLAVLGRSAPRALSREKLIAWFWPDADEERGRRSLNQALYALRSELGSEEVLIGQRDLRLNLDLVSSDAADFETAMESGNFEEAASLYRGPFLDGFHLPSAPEFEQWVEDERRSMAHRYGEALETLATALERKGDHAGAVTWWRRAANADPSSARVAIKLMRALAASGDRTGAIRHATIYATIVEQQFDMPVDGAVTALADELRSTPAPESRVARESRVASHESRETDQQQVVSVEAPLATRDSRLVTDSRPPTPSRWRLAAGIGVLLVAAILTAVKLLPVRRSDSQKDGGAPLVAVLPLQNATGDSTFSLAGAMVTDWVTQSLAQTGLVRVLDTRSLLTETGDVRELADRANVTYIITGSVFRQGDSLRFTAQLTDAHSGSIANPINVTAPASEPTAALKDLEQRVTGALAVMVDPKLSNYTASSSRPPTWEAYQEFLLGMRAFRRPYDSALARFRRAAALDTSYMQARLWAGSALGNLRRWADADSVFQTVAARRDQMAPYDRATLDYFHDGFVLGDWETAYNGARKMVELAPAAGHALWALGLTARITYRPREAIAALNRIDVSAGWGREWAVRIFGEINKDYHILGDYESALVAARRMLEFGPSDGYARTEEVLMLAALKRYGELAERVEAAGALPDDPTTWEAFSGGDLLSRVARELRAHGAPADTVRRYAEAAVTWYATPTAAGVADTVNLYGHARAAYAAGKYAESRGLYERLMAINPITPEWVAGSAAAAARLGDTTRADSLLKRVLSLSNAYMFGRRSRAAATVAVALGRKDLAVQLLAQSLKEGVGRRWNWHEDPDFVTLLDYQPFLDLLKPRG
jgi:DNA-binding SARP family transcriptional activator/TolB-like protein